MPLLNIVLNIPNHTKELDTVLTHIDKIKNIITKHKGIEIMSNNDYHIVHDEITKALVFTGDLSNFAFNVRDNLENVYNKEYKSSPSLAKELFFEHYSNVHKCYNEMKNKLFRLYDDLDKTYCTINNTENTPI